MDIRAVVGARVSVYQDDSQVSPAVQREAGERYAKQHEWPVIGRFEDLDVSASIAPWDRPDLGPWLTEKADEWDALIFSKVDRLFRSSKDCADLAYWAEQKKKILVFTEDGITLNYRDDADSFSTMMSKVFLTLASLFAEMELRRIRGRIKDAHTYIRTTDRWAGGFPPYGYMSVDHPERGKTLATDPVSREYVRTMAKMIIEDKSLWEVADYLNASGIETPTNYRLTRAGKARKNPTKGTWTSVQVAQILRSQACMGIKMAGRGTKKTVVRGANGLPIQIADPLFSDEEWLALQTALNKRSTKRERSSRAAPLLGIAYCLGCNRRLYRSSKVLGGKQYVYYRCLRTADSPACPGHSFSEDGLMKFIADEVVPKLAEIPVTKRVFVPGEDHTRELQQVKKALEGLREERDMGAYDVAGGDEEYKERLMALVTQRKILEALPQREDSWVEEPTGETYAQAYERMDTDERRNLLLSGDVRVYCSPTEGHMVNLPRNLSDRTQAYGHRLVDLHAM